MARALLRPDNAVDPLAEPVRRYLLTGDEEALDLVVRETRLRLLAAARRIGAPQDAEDSVQSAYLSLVRKRGEPLGAPVFPWLLTAVIRTAYRRKALSRREEEVARRLARPPAGPSAFTLAAGREIEERIGRAVERLPASYRDPVVLHYLAGLSTKETAGLLDLPEATVRTRLRRARILLRSRVPAGLLHGLFLVPWFLKDAAEGAGSAFGHAATGGIVMKAGGVAIVALGAATLGTLAGAKLLGGAPAAPPPPDAASVESRLVAERESLQRTHEATLKSLQSERDEARKRAEAAEDRATVLEKAAAEKPAAPAVPAPAPAPAAKGASFSFPEYDESLAKVDWKSVGESVHSMVPLMEGLHEALRKGEKPNIKELGRIQQLNGALIKAAAEVDEKLPGAGINGAYTHPAFMVNTLSATLEAAGLPLTPAQSESLGKLGREFTDRENARLQGYDAKAYDLQKILDEAELKDRFFEQALGLFTPEQREAVSPAASRGVMGMDLFSSGLMLQMHGAPLPARDLAGYAAQVERVVAQRAKVPEDRKADLSAAVKAWAAELPAEWFAEDTGPLFKVALVEEVGRRQLPLMRKIAEDLSLPEASSKLVRDAGIILLPMINKDN